jgi:hypothetical protein
VVLPSSPPGCGKSTLAVPLVDRINQLLNSAPTDAPNARPAVRVSLDGWHYSRAALDSFPDPEVAHYRRVSVTAPIAEGAAI